MTFGKYGKGGSLKSVGYKGGASLGRSEEKVSKKPVKLDGPGDIQVRSRKGWKSIELRKQDHVEFEVEMCDCQQGSQPPKRLQVTS